MARLGIRVAGAVVAGVAALAAAAPAAFAYDSYAEVSCGSSRCGYGGVTNGNTRVYSCDTKADGYGFRTWYGLKNGYKGYVDDANGSAKGCSSNDRAGTSSNYVIRFGVQWKGSDKIYWQSA